MELHTSPRIAQDGLAEEVCLRYLDRLPLSVEHRGRLLGSLTAADEDAAGARRDALAELHRVLAGRQTISDSPSQASIRARLAVAYAATDDSGPPPMVNDVLGRERLVTAPPLNRTSMVPRRWARLPRWFIAPWRKNNASRNVEGPDPASPDPRGQWSRIAHVRRWALLGLILAQTYVATNFMAAVLPYHGTQPLEVALLALFVVLFGWVSVGFWTALAGFVLLLAGGDRYAVTRTARATTSIGKDVRVAVVMPICNEDVPRVLAGLRATYESLQRTGELEQFDFFILSDTNHPDTRVAEIEGWIELCRRVGGFGRIFYRWRQHRIKRKSGNIADFCRRWGSSYRYMVVLDADSVMSGTCLTTLVRLIEANPNTGIIQTAPRAAGRDTFYARVQQFATSIYGAVFTAGLHFWQLGESYYWGHNAIIRLAPFIRYCALWRLPGRGLLSGEILSHDFVEAALMRRAGWAVWIAYDLPGSYEEMPASLLEELKRDRRWCHGNLKNTRIMLTRGLKAAHRVVFVSGAMAYVSALLWFVFLVLSTALLAIHTLTEPTYFIQPYQLFPLWPEWHPGWALGLLGATAVLLFLPKMLGVLVVIARGAGAYGGSLRLAIGMLAEFLLSTLLAPIRMLFHTQFVLGAVIGWTVQWTSPIRADAETTWRKALRRHLGGTVLGALWAGGVYWLNPSFLWWLAPVVGALIVSIPISVYTSRVSLGRRLREAGLFLIPEETAPPEEIRTLTVDTVLGAPPDFVEAVVDPVTNALVCAAGVARVTPAPALRTEREQLIAHALRDGPAALSTSQKIRLLSDPVALSRLHFDVWTSADAHSAWRNARDSAATASDLVKDASRSLAPTSERSPAPV